MGHKLSIAKQWGQPRTWDILLEQTKDKMDVYREMSHVRG